MHSTLKPLIALVRHPTANSLALPYGSVLDSGSTTVMMIQAQRVPQVPFTVTCLQLAGLISAEEVLRTMNRVYIKTGQRAIP